MHSPSLTTVRFAARAIAAAARTPANAQRRVSTDEVRAYLVRQVGKTVRGSCVASCMRHAFGAPQAGRYNVTYTATED